MLQAMQTINAKTKCANGPGQSVQTKVLVEMRKRRSWSKCANEGPGRSVQTEIIFTHFDFRLNPDTESPQYGKYF